MRKWAGLLALLAVAAAEVSSEDLDYPPEWQPYPKSGRLSRKAGDSVELRCHPRLKHEQKIVWKFKECIEELSELPCLDLSKNSDGWLYVNCGKKWCRGNLLLTNISQADSGVYQCSHVNANSNKTSHRRTIVTYILEVIEAANHPKILEVSPENITVREGSKVMFHCRAHSNSFAILFWMRKYDNHSSSHAINYQNDKYERVNSSAYIAVSENTYLSKLVLPAVRLEDSRDYVCIVADSRAFDFREVHLNVLSRNKNSSGTYQGVDTSLHLLFLIPVIMILIPTAVWFFYTHWRKRRKQNEMDPQIIPPSETVQYDGSSPHWKKLKENRRNIKYHVDDHALESHVIKCTLDWRQGNVDR